MIEIRTVSERDKLLEDIVVLWRAHSDTLGFMPKGAFDQAASEKTLLAAMDAQCHFCGYILFRKSGDSIKIAHLCVSPAAFGTGVARALVDDITRRHPEVSGISLWCRRDFKANGLWPRLGFSPRAHRRGRGRAGGELILWLKDHAHPDLLTPLNHDNRVEAVIDSCVFFDIVDEDATARGEESRALMSDWLEDSVRLLVSQEIRNDMHRDGDGVRRERREKLIGDFDELRIGPGEYKKANGELMAVLPVARDEHTRTDYAHLSWALAGGFPYFLTRDGPLLKHKTALERIGLCILTPGEFIRRIDGLERKEAYRPEEISGAKITLLKVDDSLMSSIEKLADTGAGESPRGLADQTRNLLAKPRENLVRAAKDSEGKLLALIGIVGASTPLPTLSLARMPKSSVGPTLARFIVNKLIAERGPDLADFRVSDPMLPDVLREALLQCGFQATGDGGLVRRCKAGLMTMAEAQQTFGELPSDRTSMETVIWPAKLADIDEPVYMIPINPTYASSLFDHDLARQSLFCVNPDVLMQDECVYYSAARMGIPAPGRIIWYVSHGDDGYAGTSAVRACSFLIETVKGPAKVIFKRFKRFGVFDWKQIKDIAGGPNGEITALRFSHSEAFPNAIPLNEMLSDLGSAPVGPRPIEHAYFLKLYRRGMGL